MRNILKAVAGSVAGLALFAAGAPAHAQLESSQVEAVQIQDDDIFYGDADAKVTVVEYASLTCGHCGRFHKQSLPELKKGPIADGTLRIVYRDFPLDGLALRASALARCGGPDRRLAIVGLLFDSQERWTRTQDPLSALVQIGKLAGLKEEQSRACMEDRGMFDQIIAEAQTGEQKHGVRSTPSFVANDKVYRGALTAEEMQQVIDAAQ